jgi:hypothetical protein
MRDFDMGEAWAQCMVFLRDNLTTLAILIGGTTVLSTIIQLLFAGGVAEQQAQQIGALSGLLQGGDIQDFLRNQGAAAMGVGGGLVMIIAALLSAGGTMAAFRLGLVPNGDSMGSALIYGIVATITTFLFFMAIGLVVAIPLILLGLVGAIGGAGEGPGVLFILLLIPIMILFIWIFVRLSVMQPAMAEARSANPLFGAQRSWDLTRGNALMIFLYALLTGIAIMVVSLVVGAILGFITNLFGSTIGAILLSVILSAPLAMLGAAITAGIYRSLVPSTGAADIFS